MAGIVTCMNSVAHHKHEFDAIYTEMTFIQKSKKLVNLDEVLRIPEITVMSLRPLDPPLDISLRFNAASLTFLSLHGQKTVK